MEDQKDVAPSESVCAPGAASDLVPNTNMMEKRQYNWKDITADFVEASSDLALGELLHDATFGLFEAMSAIEMMDPKMDAGMLCNQLQRKVLSLPEALETGDIKVKGFQIPELVGIMDATLACIVTWLEGHSLAQTVFTNLYLHNPYIIEDRCLKASCICTLKIVDHIRDRVNRAGVFEEEDFQTMSYGFKMAADVSDVRCTGMMKEVEEDLNRTIKTTRSKQGEERNADVEKEHELTNALFARVRFQKLFFSMLLLSEKEKCEGIPQARKTVSQLKELLPIMKSTVDIGIQPQNREVGKNDYPTIMGFEPFVNQRLLPPTFPRYTAICSRSDALQYMDEFLSRVNVVFSITDMTSLHPVLETFKDFSKSSPCVLSRSLLQLTFLPPNKRAFGVHMMTDFLKDTVRGFIAPPALSQKSALYNNYHAKSYVDAWFLQTVRPICNLIQITGHNRARQRDKWAQILEDLSLLQEEADKVDAFLHQLLVKTEPTRQHIACLGNWVLYHTIQVMISYLLSGFELELYATYEYHYIYWYLYELLYSWMTNTLHRADNFLLEHETLAESQVKGRNTKKNKKKKRTKTLTREITMAQAEQQMFGGYYKAVVGFRLDGKMSRPQFEFDSEEIQYSHRFSPFTNVSTPPFIHYSQYKEMSNYKRYEPDAAAINCYSDSCKCFFQAKTMLESLGPQDEEIQTMIRVAKTNFVVMKLLIGGHKKDSNEPPEFDFSLHNVYPVLKLN